MKNTCKIDIILNQLDIILSPPQNFVKLNYYVRLKEFFVSAFSMKSGANSARDFVRFMVLATMLAISFAMTPIMLILKWVKVRFVDIDLRQIGSILYLDLYLRDNLTSVKSGKHRIFVLASSRFDGNPYIIDLYRPYVTIVRNPIIKFLLYPFFVSPIFSGSSFRFDTIYFTENDTHDVWNRYDPDNIKPLIQMNDADIMLCRSILSKHVSDLESFVSIHVRDDGYYRLSSQDTRNADIFSYEKAIEYIIKSGRIVIRIGDPNMVDISDLKEKFGHKLFDYAKSDIRSPMMDAYLLSHCDFMIGVCSGPSCIPPLFGVNGLHINWYNPSIGPFFLKGDLCTFKKVRSSTNGNLVPLDELMSPPFTLNPSKSELAQFGFYLEDNSSDEVLESVQEFIDRRSAPATERQIKAKSLIRPTNWAYRSNGNFSETILKSYL